MVSCTTVYEAGAYPTAKVSFGIYRLVDGAFRGLYLSVRRKEAHVIYRISHISQKWKYLRFFKITVPTKTQELKW